MHSRIFRGIISSTGKTCIEYKRANSIGFGKPVVFCLGTVSPYQLRLANSRTYSRNYKLVLHEKILFPKSTCWPVIELG